jgi:hypothetical protein
VLVVAFDELAIHAKDLEPGREPMSYEPSVEVDSPEFSAMLSSPTVDMVDG